MRQEELIQMGKRLQKIRREAKMDYAQMAKLLNVTESHYRKLERGIYGLDVDKLLQLYKELRVDPLFLLTGDGRSYLTGRESQEISTRNRQLWELVDFCKRHLGEYEQEKER